MVAADGDLQHGRVKLSPAPVAGWFGFKTLWFVDRNYDGPVLIRGGRLDGEGDVAFGERPSVSQLLVPPGLTLNSVNGVRTMPGSSWVRSSGCYGWQVDGLNFSTTVILSAQHT